MELLVLFGIIVFSVMIGTMKQPKVPTAKQEEDTALASAFRKLFGG